MEKRKKIVRLLPLEDKRFKLTYFFCLVIIFTLFGRIVNLQVFSAADLKKKARAIQSSRTISLKKKKINS